MPYPKIQDGTHAFGINDSPITLAGETYIAEDFSWTQDANVVEIANEDGIPVGQAILPQNFTGAGTVQLKNLSTPVPPIGATFVADGITFYITGTGKTKTQGAYQKVPISFTGKLAP